MNENNEIVNKFLLAGDKFMPEMHSKFTYSLNLHIVLVDHLQKTKKDYKNLKKQEIHNIFNKTNKVKLAFNITWPIKILKI